MERARRASGSATRTKTRSAAAVAGRSLDPSILTLPTAHLKRIVTEWVCSGRDDAIAALMDGIERGGDALTVRRAAENVASTLCVKRDGIETYARLFTVSIVIVFDDEVPESHVDPLLRKLLLSRSSRLAMETAARSDSSGSAAILDEVFELEGLRKLTLSRVREAAEAMNEGRQALALQRFGADKERPARRSGAFARFLIGQRTGVEDSGVIATLDLRALARQIVDAMRDRIRVKTEVSVQVSHEFFEGLFAGMWEYRDARIGQVCRLALERLDGESGLRARAETYGSASNHGVRLWLQRARAAGCTCRYRISGRPGTPISCTLERVVTALQCAGVEEIERVRCELQPDGAAGNGCLCDGRSALAIAI